MSCCPTHFFNSFYMKVYTDSKGKTVKFGDVIEYHENFNKDGVVMKYDIAATLNEDSLPFLKEIGAIKEDEKVDKKMSDLLPNYEKILSDTIGGVYEKNHTKTVVPADMNRFFEIFPVPYISLLMNIIKHDRDNEKLGKYGFIYNIGTNKISLTKTEGLVNTDNLNIFSSLDKINECLAIIQPVLKKYYSRFLAD